MSDDLTDRITKALDGTTPGPWWRLTERSNVIYTSRPIDIDEADWGPEAQTEWDPEKGAFTVATVADGRAWSYADCALIAAAPSLLAEARDEITRLEQWKADATEVLAGLKLLDAPSTQPEGET